MIEIPVLFLEYAFPWIVSWISKSLYQNKLFYNSVNFLKYPSYSVLKMLFFLNIDLFILK